MFLLVVDIGDLLGRWGGKIFDENTFRRRRFRNVATTLFGFGRWD